MDKEFKKLITLGETETVEFKQSLGEFKEVIISLVAFANTTGGQVIVGVSDYGNICGVQVEKESEQKWINEIKTKTLPSIMPDIKIKNIEDKQVVVFEISEYPIKPVSFKGRYYKRVSISNHQMTVEEVANLHLKTLNTSWDYYCSQEHRINDISFEKVNSFLSFVNKYKTNLIKDESLTVLKKFELLRNDKITNGCFLLFMKEISGITTVELGRFSDEVTIKDSLTVKTDLFSEVDQIMLFIQKHINKSYIITDKPQREERWDYPLEAIREIVINMIVHRDYMNSSDSIIKIFEDRIEFFNPGNLLGGLTENALLRGDYVSSIRNKQIALIFKEAGFIEKYGSGIKRILTFFNQYKLPQPKFENFQHGFRVTIQKSSRKSKVDLTKTPTKTPTKTLTKTPTKKEDITSLEAKILKEIKKDRHMTAREISENLNIGRNTVLEYIKRLKVKSIIIRIGSNRNGYWEVL